MRSVSSDTVHPCDWQLITRTLFRLFPVVPRNYDLFVLLLDWLFFYPFKEKLTERVLKEKPIGRVSNFLQELLCACYFQRLNIFLRRETGVKECSEGLGLW